MPIGGNNRSAEKAQNFGKTFKRMIKELEEKGYNPVNQIVGYLLSGDPTYITSHNNARSNIRRIERDELIEELVRSYVKHRGL